MRHHFLDPRLLDLHIEISISAKAVDSQSSHPISRSGCSLVNAGCEVIFPLPMAATKGQIVARHDVAVVVRLSGF